MKTTIQKTGRLLSGMVMPNIAAFIAWGFLTAFFIPTGWWPNENLAKMVGPIITYLLPLLIGFKGGEIVGGNRGGVLGAVATTGVIVGGSIPMLMGAMIVGPIAGLAIKKTDAFFVGKVPAGFEMLVNNFSAGILGMLLAIGGFLGVGPVVESLNALLAGGLERIVAANLLPLASVIIEPAKVLFLNNAINHGILGPLGIQGVQETGKSIFFLLETNPGPGLGVLLAYWMFAKGSIRQSAPGAIIIHFLGGIHEIYFPYILMKPKLLLAVIAGGATGVFTFSLFGVGLVATPSPGSIFALMAMAPRGNLLGVILGVASATAVSFLVGSVILKMDKTLVSEQDLDMARQEIKDMKQSGRGPVKKIVFACDAGMGSSAMGASKLRNKLKARGLTVEVVNEAIENIPKDAQVVIVHKNLLQRAKESSPLAEHIPIEDFLNAPAYDALVERLAAAKEAAPAQGAPSAEPVEAAPAKAAEAPAEGKVEVLQKKNILLNLPPMEKEEAIRMAGRLLVDSGYVEESYIDAMLQREADLTTYIGNGVAIPHGVGEAKKKILKTGICILQFPQGVKFEDDLAYVVIGIAGIGNEHISILANLATVMEKMETVEKVRTTDSVDYIHDLFTSNK
ncbi:PTS mannitol transporter subunit IICBA [Anaerotalea alkaliphila]|nr:PTS mannitol transporter subunit IICBA [Anaerotalea alkaliphila]